VLRLKYQKGARSAKDGGMATFQAAFSGGFRTCEILSEFLVHGEAFVVHKLDSGKFRVSHKETGFAISNLDDQNKMIAEQLARVLLGGMRPEDLQSIIDRARANNAQAGQILPLPFADRIKLAGDCLKCEGFDLARGEYGELCRKCSRYYGDMFRSRAASNNKFEPTRE
jgi:hypothetical protein